MEFFWYTLIVIILTVFFILDGYDFGVGIIHLFFARTEADKAVITKSAGLFWDSNEVWLVAAGGMIFMAFPTYYASVFSGMYLPLMMVLWLVIFRAMGLEFRSQFNNQLWKDLWDKAFGLSSLLLALFFGIALGNIVRGVNLGSVQNGLSLHDSHYFFLPLWTDFSPYSLSPGVIDWFTLLLGIVALLVFAIHGANWIILKTKVSIHSKLKSVVFKLNFILFALTLLLSYLWHLVNPHVLDNFYQNPLLLIFPLLYWGGLIGLFRVRELKNETIAFLLSTALIAGGITFSLATIFPIILPSTNSINPPLTIYNTGAGDYAMSVAIPWGIFGFILLFVYFIVQKRLTAGKIDSIKYGH